MAVITYEIPSGRIVHDTKVDFSYRSVQKPIYIVQYDKQLPIIAVSLYVSGKTYTLPANMDVNLKFGKRDKTFVYKPVIGCNASRNIVYFEVDEQMSFIHGSVNPILELSFVDGEEPQRAGSSPIAIEIDRNPIQESDIESSNEYSIWVEEAANDGKTYARKNKSWVEVMSGGGGLTVETWNTATKTLALSDANKLFNCSNINNQTLTIPTNTTVAFPIGTMITFLLTSTYTVTFVGASDVTLMSIDSLVELATQFAMASLIKIDTNTWQLVGALE